MSTMSRNLHLEILACQPSPVPLNYSGTTTNGATMRSPELGSSLLSKCNSAAKRIVVLGNAPIDNGNRGCVAMSYCAIYLIDLIFGQNGYELYLTDSAQQPGRHKIVLNDRTIEYQTIGHFYPANIKGLVLGAIHCKETYRRYSLLRKADFIFDIGEGDSFSDIYGQLRFQWIDTIHREARLLSKPYVLLPQTIGPFTDQAVLGHAIRSIKQASFVMARDKASLRYLREIAPNQKNVGEYVDVAFFLPYTKNQFCKDFVHVGLNVSALLWHGGYTRDNQFGLTADYKKTVQRIIDFFLAQKDVKLHLIAHVVDTERTVENDYAVAFDIWRKQQSDRLTLAPLFLSPVDAKDYIAGMDFFMGARMHSTIAAFSSGVPVVPMAYSRKFNGLFVDSLGYDHVADLVVNDEASILNNIKQSFLNRTVLQREIASKMESIVKVGKDKLIHDIKSLLHQGEFC